jgi:PAS domain S-box-containing protein
MRTTMMSAFRVEQPPKLVFKASGNECATLIESIDWSATAMGAMDQWPQSLHITLGIILNSKFPMLIFWGTNHICFYNDAARLRNEGKHPFAMGKKAKEVWPENWLSLKAAIDQVLHKGESNWNEDQLVPVYRNGVLEEVYATYSYSAIYDEYGKRTGVLVTEIETTDKVKNLKKLQESERNFRNLIMQAPVGIAIMKGWNFTFEVANNNYLEVVGKTQSILGQPLQQAIPEIADQGFHGLLTKVMLTGMSYHGKEFPVNITRRGREETLYVNFVYEPLKENDGSIKRIMVIVIDVTEQVIARKKAEETQEELIQMADAMPQLVWVANAAGEIIYISDRISEYSGARELDNGRWFWESMLHPDDAKATLDTYSAALKNHTLYEKEHRLMMRDGTFKWHLTRAFPYVNEAGEVTKWFGTATDIDEQKRQAEQLELRVQERTKELQKSNNELEQFAYIASHDLQEPLRKITNYIELLNKNLPEVDAKSKTYLQKIDNSSQRMSTLIKDILNFSQLSKPTRIYKPVDLNEVLKNISQDLELMIQQKQAVIKSDSLPTLQAIPLQMHQLFYNLISNSLKFVQEGRPPVIQVRASLLTPKETAGYINLRQNISYYRIEFKDNGIGFDAKYAEQIFTIFQRLNTHQSYAGTGIGLALCKKIVLNHHGHISASSEENKGATFHVILPVEQPDSSAR